MINKNDLSTDGEKRGKLLLLAAFIALSLFVSKIIQTDTQVLVWKVYLNAFIYFVIVFVGLLWSFNFQIKKKSFIYILQSSLFVFSQELFVEFFFFQKFSRIYEAFILLALILVVFFINYFSFLAANVFNVNLFRKIPLVQVARTASYLISIFMMYFFTFSILLSGFNIYILLVSIFLFYLIISLIHYINMEVGEGEIFRKTILTTLISFILFLGVFLSGDTHELISIVPIVGYYFSVSLVTQENLFKGNFKNIYLYISVLVIIFLSVLFFEIFN